jgi:diacylglycerol kinase (ATP)
VELLNSAIEAAVDHTSIDHHALAGRAKDIGSAAVMVAIFLFLLVWGLVIFG